MSSFGADQGARPLEVTFTPRAGAADVIEAGPPPVSSPRWSPPKLSPERRRGVLLTAAVVAALLVTAFVFYQWGGSGGTPAATPSASPSPSASKDPTTAAIYAKVSPSVVLIESLGADGKPVGSGTGVIVNGNGSILTAFHVVKGATGLKITFGDGTESAATVEGSDPASDIALLTPGTLPSVVVPAVLGGSRTAVGDPVVAIGNPLGLTLTTTTGVISGLNRTSGGTDGTTLRGLIQFDAAVNPGSSGGPLLNGKGEVIGIVVALVNPTSANTFIGIGFAVPIGTAVGGPGGGQAPQQ